MFNPSKPYNDLPLLPPAVDIESKTILKVCVRARAALASMNASANLLPNSTLLINTIPLLEAQASSEIENIVTTNDELFRQAQLDEATMSSATKEALRYRTALRDGFDNLRARPLSTRTAVEICRTIKGAGLDVRKTPGVTLRNAATGETVYTPPDGEAQLRDFLANWEQFIHANDGIDPLIKLAVQHYQFEAIHPFIDGNGRTGRILNVLYLVEKKLLALPLLYLSRYILNNRNDYYYLLNSVTAHGAWEDWIKWILVGSRTYCGSN